MKSNMYEKLVPARPDYQDPNVSLEEAFEWLASIANTGPNGLFVTEFGATHNLEAREAQPDKAKKLHRLDDAAHQDIKAQPGFLHYRPDSISANGESRSICVFESAEHARAATIRPVHQEAARYPVTEGRVMYKSYRVNQSIIELTPKGLWFSRVFSLLVEHGDVVSHTRSDRISPQSKTLLPYR